MEGTKELTNKHMKEKELQEFLLKNYPQENEKCEWKEFKQLKHHFNGHEGDDVISYVSAISNMEGGHLIIGVKDKTLELTKLDTYNYRPQTSTLRLINECNNLPSEGLKIEELRTSDTDKLVWIIHIPKHSPRLPVYAHKKMWQRVEDNLVSITKSRLESILQEPLHNEDWSAEIIPDASIQDLEPQAMKLAREKFKEFFNGKRDEEIDGWSDEVFLNKAKLTRKSAITRTTIILLGRPESDHFLNPSICKIRWFLKSDSDPNKDFRVFTIPMILAIEEIGSLIRNTSYTFTINGTLFPEKMFRYDSFTLREPLNNAIAHQDYSKGCHIDIIEYEDNKLKFRNAGNFIPDSVESVVLNDFPESYYRNPALVEAMRNIKMVDTEGGGIRKLFLQQRKRFFPMPIYDLQDSNVTCTIEGNILDENFAKILSSNENLTIKEIMLLDAVQKHIRISKDAADTLRKKGLIEGRYPNIYLSAKLVGKSGHIGLKSSYIKNKSFEDDYYKKIIIEYIRQYKKATRKELTELCENKFPEFMNKTQRYDKLTNLLSSLKKKKLISYDNGVWSLVN